MIFSRVYFYCFSFINNSINNFFLQRQNYQILYKNMGKNKMSSLLKKNIIYILFFYKSKKLKNLYKMKTKQ